ncbi:MAG TPA: carboxypeptidase regulatory-like domain-containing protein [Thermoanaerobaculia bacterium]
MPTMKATLFSTVLFHILAFSPLLAQPVLTGVVHGTRNEPLSGAQIELLPVPSNFEAGRLRLEGRDLPGPRVTAASDAQGRFSLATPHAGAWKIVVRAAGRVPMQYGPLLALEAEELPAVRLPQDAGARIRLVAEDGQPVAGAWIVASTAGEVTFRGGGWRPEFRVGRSASDGSLSLPRLEDERLQVSVFAPGRSEERLTDFQTGTIRLQPAREKSLVLQAAAPDGAPVAGLLVRMGDQSWPVGQTAADGTVRLPFREGEEIELRLVTPDGRQYFFSFQGPRNGGRRIVTLPPPVQVTGKVLDASSGRGLADAVLWWDADPAITVRTDREGKYTVAASAKESLSLTVRAAGFLPGRLTVSGKASASGRAPALALERAARLRGSAIGPEGKPLAGAFVTAVESSRTGTRTFSPHDPVADRATTGPEGRFDLRRLRAGEEYELRVSKPGFFPEARGIVIPGRGPEPPPVVVKLRPACAVHGWVRDQQGRPVASARVFLRPSQRPGRERQARGPEADAHDPTASVSESDAAGRFALPESPAAEVDLEVRKAGYAPAQRRTLRVGPSCGDSFDFGPVVLAPGARLAGRVVNRRDEAIAGAEVFLVDRSLSRMSREATPRGRKPDAVTGRDGTFALADLRRGVPHHLLVKADGYLEAEVQGARPPGRGPILIRLDPAAFLRGRVVDEAGQAVSGAVIDLEWQEVLPEDPDERTVGTPLLRSARSNSDGRFEITALPEGEVKLDVRAPGLIPLEAFEVAIPRPDTAPELTLTLRRGARLEGRVTTTDGKPVPGARVSVDTGSALSDAEGAYTVDGLAPGQQEVRVFHPHYKRIARPLLIQEGANRFDFELEAGVEVAGQVMDQEGKAVVAAEVELIHLSRSDRRSYRAYTGEDGRFLLHPVAAGRYRLKASAPGLAAAARDQPVVVASQPVDDLEIVLRKGATLGGRVLGLSAEELATVAVTVHGEAGERPVSIDSEGLYEVRDLSVGDWLLRASLWQGERQVEVRVPVGPSDLRLVRDLEFSRKVTLSGRVLFDDEPLAGSIVSVRGERFSVERSVASDFDGGFVLQDLEPDRYWLGVKNPQRLIVHNATVDLHESREMEIRLEAATIAGRVEEEASGEAVSGALLSLRPTQGADFLMTNASKQDGAFRIIHVPPGSYRLSVAANGFAPLEREISVAGGEELAGLELGLTRTRGAEILVHLASGQVPALVHVLALDGEGKPILKGSYMPKPSGVTELSSLPAGTWQLFVSAPGGAMAKGTVTVPGEPVTLTLAPAGRLHIRISDLASENLLATLQLLRQETDPFWTLGYGGLIERNWIVKGGKVTVEGVPAGLWSVIVDAGDGRVWRASVATPGTGEATLSIP